MKGAPIRFGQTHLVYFPPLHDKPIQDEQIIHYRDYINAEGRTFVHSSYLRVACFAQFHHFEIVHRRTFLAQLVDRPR